MYRKFSSGWAKHYDFMFFDIVCVEIAYLLSCIIRDGAELFMSSSYLNVALLLIVIEFMVGIFFSSYKGILRRGYLKEFKAVLLHTGEVWACLSIAFYMLRIAPGFSRAVFVLAWSLHMVFSYVVRILWKKFLIKRLQEKGDRAFIIITTSQIATKVVETIKENNLYGLKIVGLIIMDKKCTGDYYAGVPVVSDKDEAEEYLCRNWVDEVFVNLPEYLEFPKNVIEICEEMGITVHLRLARIDELKAGKRMVQNLAGYSVITSTVNTLDRRQAMLKRMMDIGGGVVGTLITVVLFVFIAPIVYMKSPGPIFFTQTRIGKNGRTFKMYKFRSMYIDAEKRKKELLERGC